GTLSVEGIKGWMIEGGTASNMADEAAEHALGGKLETFYYAFVSPDVYTIVDVPDNVTAVTLAMGVASTGTVRTTTTVLLTPEEIDAATKKSLAFRAAGQ